MDINVYLVKSRGFRAYVLASDTNSAWDSFKKYLEDKNYGYYWERDFSSIELVANGKAISPKTAEGCSYDDRQKDDLLLVSEL